MSSTSSGAFVFESTEQIQATFSPFLRGVAAAIGPRCEIVLHDLSAENVDLKHTIVMIINGHVSGRKVGGPSSNLGFDVLGHDQADHDDFGYSGITADGRELRSSSVYFRNPAGRIIAALCINYDVNALEAVKSLLDELEPSPGRQSASEKHHELVGPDLTEVVDDMITRTIAKTGRTQDSLTRDDRIRVVKTLDDQGVTGVNASMERIAKRLGVSRSTAYQYLEEARRI